jgi:hypothetical protein
MNKGMVNDFRWWLVAIEKMGGVRTPEAITTLYIESICLSFVFPNITLVHSN